MTINDKLKKVREIMIREGIDCFIVPSTDPHSSEYVHPHWKSRAWLSGFNGSAGTLIITHDRAGLWTDFRYYIEAADCIKDNEFVLFKQGMPDTPSFSDFINVSVKKGGVVGIDGSVFTTSLYESLKKEIEKSSISIKRDFDPITELWEDRPKRPDSKAYNLDIKFCGEDRRSKISRIREQMVKNEVDSYIISSLADIAWLFNIRANDVEYTPLVLSYALLKNNSVYLYINDYKLNEELKASLKSDGITIKDYSDIADDILRLESDSTIYYNPEILNSYLSGLISDDCNVKRGIDFTAEFKSVKNEVEIKNTRIAMEKDGAALVKFFKDLEERIERREEITEFSVAPALREARLSMEGCVDESFAPIIGYESNGALCHYSADEKTAKEINPVGLLLVDSGGQYYEGTTDITRTITLGLTSDEEILHYTLVLKGHVQLSLAKFPEGTNGAQLDILARQPLWERGLNFGHGTGHGVGFFLGVHEGPQNISPKSYNCTLIPGQITSNEPGIYIEGKHGIRIENLVLTKECCDGLYQKFYEFETLTLFPYDVKLIDKRLLTDVEVAFINNYHSEVVKRLSKYLNEEELKWLKGKAIEI